MQPNVKIVAGDIVNSAEEAVVVPCSTQGECFGRGVDIAVYSKFPEVRERWSSWIKTSNVGRTMDFGDTFVTEDDGRVFILVAVPPMNESNYYYCNLETCYHSAFDAALEEGCKTVACPLLGTGNMRWEIGESFFSLYSTLTGPLGEEYRDLCVTLYLKNEKTEEFARQNNWDIAQCFDEKPLDKRIDFLSGMGYEDSESYYLQMWYAEKERVKRLKKSGIPDGNVGTLERGTRFLLSQEASEQLELISKSSEKKLQRTDIVKRSGLDKNTVSYIFAGNERANPDKDKLLAFGYAMQCSYGKMCKWLSMLGFCFTGSGRDRLIEEAFLNRTSSDVKYLNIKLKNRGFPPLQTSDPESERSSRVEFAGRLSGQISFLMSHGRNDFSDNELAGKSGMTVKDVRIIRNAADYSPKKDKVISLAAALRCSAEQLTDWLKVFGMSLSDGARDQLIRKAFDERTVRDARELNSLLTSNGHEHLNVTAFKPERGKDI